MSANEKQISSVKQKRLQEREAAAKRAKSFKIKTIICVVVFVIVAAALLILTSDWFYQNCTAVEINDVKWSIADYNFHFNNQYNIISTELKKMLGDDAGDKIPERGAALKKAVFNQETGETWHDYLTNMTMNVLTEVTILYQDAMENDYTLNEAEQSAMFNEINTMALYASYSGVDASTYASMIYGKGVDVERYETNLNIVYIVDSYANSLKQEYSYSDAELDAYYNENADAYDHYTYRSYYVRAEGAEVNDAAMADAKAKAEEFAGKVTDEASFAELCREYCTEAESARYVSDDASLSTTVGESIAAVYKDWIQDDSRKAGDVTVVESVSGYYVVYFVERDHNDYNSADVEYFVMIPELVASENGLTGDDYDKAVEKLSEDAAETSQKIYEDLKEGKEFSAVKYAYSGNVYQSGSVTGASKAYFASNISKWIFAEDRKAGDVEKITTDTGEYYVLRYVGENDVYSKVFAGQKMSEIDFNEWLDTAMEDADVSVKTFKFLAK